MGFDVYTGIEYSRLPIICQRYTLEDKMNICQYFSRKTMDVLGFNADKIDKLPKTWDLETFLMIFIMGKDSNLLSFKKNINNFYKIIDSIQNFMHPKIKEKVETNNAIDFIFSVFEITQFNIQKYYLYKYYRYNYIYSFKDEDLNMAEKFMTKGTGRFGAEKYRKI